LRSWRQLRRTINFMRGGMKPGVGGIVAGSAGIAACVAPGFGTEVGSAGTGAFAEVVADEEDSFAGGAAGAAVFILAVLPDEDEVADCEPVAALAGVGWFFTGAAGAVAALVSAFCAGGGVLEEAGAVASGAVVFAAAVGGGEADALGVPPVVELGAEARVALAVAAFTACWQADDSFATLLLRHCSAWEPPRGTLLQ
jgi:hypothetical protein